jgi:ABC-2 type transport system permease protein
MLVRIGNLIVKEFIQFGRDRVLLIFILLAPALQLILMAQSIERGINEQPVTILDLDHSRLSRELVISLDNSQELRVQFYAESMETVRQQLDKGQTRLAVIIPAGFALGLGRADSPQRILIVVDATNTVAASTTMASAAGVVGRFSSDLAAGQGLVIPEFVDFRANVRFNPTMDFRDYSIPAQLGFITYQVTLAVAALGLARERELGTLEQLMVTPLRRFEMTLGKGIPAVVIGWMNFAVMWVIGLYGFQVPMLGSPLTLAILTLLFITTVVSWGLVISAISRTQQQAILFVFILAMTEIALSGFLVPVKNMPPLLQGVSRFVPLRHYLVIVRGIMLKGAGFGDLLPEIWALLGLSLVMGLLALRIVARRIE